METIRIAHLYYDLMNLYGEHGNILGLVHHLEKHGAKVILHSLSLEDEIDFAKYDVFYIGSGNEKSFSMVLLHLLKYKEEVSKAYQDGKFFMVTGNALNLFGKVYHTLKDEEKETLNILDYEAHEVDFRIVGEQEFKLENEKNEIIGFQNRNSVLKYVKEPFLFEVIQGTGYVPNSSAEGIHQNHFYGTYLLGPIFIRNPHFVEYFIKDLFAFKNIPYKKYDAKDEIQAYQEYKKNLLHES